jgi:hypothetical protein
VVNCCCTLIIVKLETKRMKAMANVSPIADTDETANDDDIFIMPRIRDRFHNKIRYRVIIL